MRVRGYSFQLRGWKAALLMGVLAAVGVLVLFLGIAMLIAGVAVSVVAALAMAIRGRLGGAGAKPAAAERFAEAPASSEPLLIRDIEVDEVLVDRRR